MAKRGSKKTVVVPVWPKPTDPKQGADQIRAAILPLFDPNDGYGADWMLMLKSVFKLGFQIADGQPDSAEKSKIMTQVQAYSYDRMVGNKKEPEPVAKQPAYPSNTDVFNARVPRPK